LNYKIIKIKMKRVIIIDNYDSFTYNLVHYIEQFTNDFKVARNNEVDIKEIGTYNKILFSPGPGLPSEVEIMKDIIEKYKKTKSIFGICLGHQAIAEYFGAKLLNLHEVDHGIQKNTIVVDESEIIFKNIPKNFLSGRYHSWLIDKATLPKTLKITAVDNNDHIMAISHNKFNIKGVQFHPESIMTPEGLKIIENWILE